MSPLSPVVSTPSRSSTPNRRSRPTVEVEVEVEQPPTTTGRRWLTVRWRSRSRPSASRHRRRPTPDDATTGGGRTIRIDAADDPPDAVYLAAGDPLLAASAGGRSVAAPAATAATDGRPSDGTVFIDDQTSTPAPRSASPTRRARRGSSRAARAADRRQAGRWPQAPALGARRGRRAGPRRRPASPCSARRCSPIETSTSRAPCTPTRPPCRRSSTTCAARRCCASTPTRPSASSRRSRGWRTPGSRRLPARRPDRDPRARAGGDLPRARTASSGSSTRKGRVLDVLADQPVDYLLVVSADAPNLLSRPVRPAGLRRRGQPGPTR